MQLLWEKWVKLLFSLSIPTIEYQSTIFSGKTSLFSLCFLYLITQDDLLMWIPPTCVDAANIFIVGVTSDTKLCPTELRMQFVNHNMTLKKYLSSFSFLTFFAKCESLY